MSVNSVGNAVGTVIVGGGIAGVALAYYLSEMGETDILLVEGRELASGCTGGSMGGVRQQFSTPVEVEVALRGRRFWQTFEATFDYPCPYHQDGYLFATGRPDLYENLGKAAEVQRAGGAVNVEMIEAKDLTDLVPWLNADGLIGGCWTPDDGRVNPTDGVYGLASAARRNGVTIRQQTLINGITQIGDDWLLDGADPIRAKRVVVAGGLGSPALLAPFGVNLEIKPMWVHYGYTTPVASDQRMPLFVDLDTGFCVEREQDGAVVTILDSDAPQSYGVEDMLSDFAELAADRAPVFAEVGIRKTISAAADATGGDGHPYIGEVEPGLWAMAGFDGHGTMQGPAYAEFTANLLSGKADPVLDPKAYDPHRAVSETLEWLRAARK